VSAAPQCCLLQHRCIICTFWIWVLFIHRQCCAASVWILCAA
jgi:hypothetical protein